VRIDELLQRLAPLASRDTRKVEYGDRFSFISAFVTRKTEVIQTISMPVAGLLVVIEGEKQIALAGRLFKYRPGQAFSLPAGTIVDVVNEPDATSGVYRALFLGFSNELLEEARRKWSCLARSFLSPDPTVVISPALASAILHTSEALAGTIDVSPRVTEQRLQEILLMLAECGAAPLRPDHRKVSTMSDAVRAVVRAAPSHPWVVARVAAELCTSEPTLRRHLRLEGHSFREILAVERMSAARTMLMEGRSNVSEAALIGGYASLSHFAKRFKQIYGYLPSRIEQAIAQAH
jgi:AraC-like DNA-binding protein/quercetin dioxygenase-like cupin family protein